MDQNQAMGPRPPTWKRVLTLVGVVIAALVVAVFVAVGKVFAKVVRTQPQQLKPWQQPGHGSNAAQERLQARLQRSRDIASRFGDAGAAEQVSQPDFQDTMALGPVPTTGQERNEVQESTATTDLIGASRVNVIQLKGSQGVDVGAMWFYRFDRQGVIKRKLKVNNPTLAQMFEKASYYLPDEKWDGSAQDLERIIKLTSEEVLVLLATATRRHYQKLAHEAVRQGAQASDTAQRAARATGRRGAKHAKAGAAPDATSKGAGQAAKPQPPQGAQHQGQQQGSSPGAQALGNAPGTASATQPQANYTPPVVTGVVNLPLQAKPAQGEQSTQGNALQGGSLNLPVAGETYEGLIAEMGNIQRTGREGLYTTFCLQLLQAGVMRPFYGGELERELMACQAKLGDRVQVTYMGKHNTGGAGGKAFWRNLYKVVKIANGEGTL